MQSDALHHLAEIVADLEERDAVDTTKVSDVDDSLGKIQVTIQFDDTPYQDGEADVVEAASPVSVPAPRDSDGAADGEPDLADDPDLEGDVDEDDADESEDDQDDAEKSFEAGVPLVSNQPYVDLDGDEDVTVHVAAAQNGPAECNYVRDASRLQAKAPGEFDAPANVCGVCQDRANPTPEWLTQDDESEDDQDEEADDEDAPTGGNSTAVDVDQPREVSLPDGLALDDVQNAVDAHEDLGAIADELDLECGRTRVLLVHLNHYSEIRDVTKGYRGGSRQ